MTLRHFLADDDLTAAEQAAVLDLADALKADPYKISPLAGPRSVALLFDKPTLRTQTSFSAGIVELGGFPMIVDGRLAGIGERESVADTARVLGRQCAGDRLADLRARPDRGDGRVRRGAGGQRADRRVPSLPGRWPTCMTIREHRGRLAGLTLAYVGDGANNMAHSYLLAGALAGLHVRIGAPAGFQPDPDIVGRAEALAAASGGSVLVTESAARGGGRRRCRRHRHLGLDGQERTAATGRPLRPVRGDRRAARRRPRTRSCCTACPPTGARRSPPRCSTGRSRWSGTRPRTGGTCRRRSWPSCLDERGASMTATCPAGDDPCPTSNSRADPHGPAGQDHRAARDP